MRQAERRRRYDRPSCLARRGGRASSRSTPTRPWRKPARRRDVILVRVETSPEDIDGMHAAAGILTSTRRHDQPRRRGRPRHGAAAACAAPAPSNRREGRHDDRRRPDTSARATCHASTAQRATVIGDCVKMRRSPLSGDFAKVMSGRTRTARSRSAPMPTRPRRQAGARLRRRRHRPVPHRAHVLRARAHPRHARR